MKMSNWFSHAFAGATDSSKSSVQGANDGDLLRVTHREVPLMPLHRPIFLFCSAVALSSCGLLPTTPSEPPPKAKAVATDDITDSSVLKLAQVESVRATIPPAQPPVATVIISGLLHDGATRVHEIQQQRLADGFVLTVITARPRNAVATLALIPFERTVRLDLSGMNPGACRVVANGVAATVTVP